MRSLLKGLLLIAITLMLGNALLADVGYVLIRYHNLAIESSLLVMILFSTSLLCIIFWVLRRLPYRPAAKASATTPTMTHDFSEQAQRAVDEKNWSGLDKLLQRHRKKMPSATAERLPFLRALYHQRLTDNFRTHTNNSDLIADWQGLSKELLTDTVWITSHLQQYSPEVTDIIFPWLFQQTENPDYLLAWAKHTTQDPKLRVEKIRAAKLTPLSSVALGLSLESIYDLLGAQLAYEHSLLMQHNKTAFLALGALLSKQQLFAKATECYQRALNL
jgi:hypothetical protein